MSNSIANSLEFLSAGLFAVGNGLGMVCLSAFPSVHHKHTKLHRPYFQTDEDALAYDWKCICSDMQTVCNDLKQAAENVR